MTDAAPQAGDDQLADLLAVWESRDLQPIECNAMRRRVTGKLKSQAAEIKRLTAALAEKQQKIDELCRSEIRLLRDFCEMRERAEAAERERDALKEDAARLDFVMERQLFVTWTTSDAGARLYQLMAQDEHENFIAVSGEGAFFNSTRAAIDAARLSPPAADAQEGR